MRSPQLPLPSTPLVHSPASDLAAYAPFLTRLEAGAPFDERVQRLVDAAIALSMRPGFDELVSLPHLRFVPFPHQIAAARRALAGLRGRAILADEVGLGKTIEACLVLSELSHRRLLRRALILVPPGLVEQWSEEIDQKFALPALVLGSEGWGLRLRPWDAPLIVASLATARRTGWSETIADIEWDLVIVDEAHRLRNPQSASAQLVKKLRARRLLLLTATPVENRLEDLFHLVNLVRPGLLGTQQAFRRTHAAGKSGAPASNVDSLQRRMRDVMIRHRRSEVALMLPKRLAHTVAVHPGLDELTLYREVAQRVRDAAPDASGAEKFALRALLRAAGSSPRALAFTLERRGWDDLAARAGTIGTVRKAAVLFDLVEHHRARGEKVIVFTGFRRTLDMLADLARARMPVAVYHGGLDRRQKAETIRMFESGAPLLLTTEAAGEGRNLQFCHVLVNYDLPWNPMQIEQRLGRVHRIGQQHDVVLTNLVSVGTLEEHILRVLEAKINLFELVVGELDMILGRIDDDFDFERFVFESHVASRDDAEFIERVELLGDDLARARGAYAQSRATTDLLVGAEDGA